MSNPEAASRSFRSSVDVLEDFYGDQLSASLLALIRRTPLDQLVILAERVVRHNRMTEQALEPRNAREEIHKLYGGYADQPLAAHDAVYVRGGQSSRILETPQLKHLLLLNEHVLVPDPIIDWAEETWFLDHVDQSLGERETAEYLHSAAKQVLRIMSWVRIGAVVLVASREHLSLGYHADGHLEPVGGLRYPLKFQGTLDVNNEDIFWRDPYLAWCVVHRLNAIEPWRFDTWGLNVRFDFQEAASYILSEMEYDKAIAGRLQNLIEIAHGPGISVADVEPELGHLWPCRARFPRVCWAWVAG